MTHDGHSPNIHPHPLSSFLLIFQFKKFAERGMAFFSRGGG